MHDTITPKGVVHFVLKDADGNVKLDFRKENLVTNAGRNWSWLMGCSATPPAKMGWIALGTGTFAAAITDTVLQTELASTRTATGTTGTVTTTASQWTATFGPGVGTGALTEAGIFNSATTGSGTLLAHIVFGTITKNAGDTLTITWTITLS